MRIQELDIGRFGIWQDVRLPFSDTGITVLYGPNEAGKSTLMRFIRGVLFGYQTHDLGSTGSHRQDGECAGSIRITHDSQTYHLRRRSTPGSRGRLEINGKSVSDSDPLLRRLTGDVGEAMFQNVFAIGLHELQQLATLDGEEIGRHLYGVSLGPEGEQFVRAQAAFTRQEQQLIGNERTNGEIVDLVRKLGDVDAEIDRLEHPTSRHAQLLSQLEGLESQVAQRKARQAELQREIRGHQFLLRVWEPWKKERELRHRLDMLPSDEFDRETMLRFDELEQTLSEIDERRQDLVREARRLQKEADAIQTRPELEQQMCAIQRLHETRDEVRTMERKLTSHRSPRDQLDRPDRAVQSLLAKLDGRWDEHRLQATDVSPASMQHLMGHANAYRNAMRRRTRSVKRYKKLSAALKRRQQAWKSLFRDLGTESVSEARKELTHRIHDLEELRGLRIRQEHLQQAHRVLGDAAGAQTFRPELPALFWWVIGAFVLGGFALLTAGIIWMIKGFGGPAAAHGWVIGLIYTLMGISAFGVSRTMSNRFSSGTLRVTDSGDPREDLNRELFHIQEAVQRITRQESLRSSRSAFQRAAPAGGDLSEDALLVRTRQQLAELDQAEREAKRIDALRRRLSSLRQGLQDQQRHVSRTKRDWTDDLKRMGLAESLKVSPAFEQCQYIAEAKQLLEDWRSTHQGEEYERRHVDEYRAQVARLGEILEGAGFSVADPYQQVADWDRELKLLGERRRERNQLRQSAKEKRRESSRLVDKIERLREQRATLLTRLGVADKGEIVAKLAAIDERQTLEAEIRNIRQQIERLAASEPELAVVEDDLLAFENSRSRRSVEDLRGELQRIEEQLQSDYQTIGQLKQEVREIEEDRSLSSLRFDREQIVDAIRDATERWGATRLADHVVETLRKRIERERQPETLKAASEYLRKLTCGNYHNIWTPLGERALLVDDDHGHALRVEHLSSGTREQVFLAVRLAMIRNFAQHGTELPMILDDVTVNFDQVRTEAAVQTLMNVADQGQQILLFTCHLHLAHMFENQGVESVWLPNQRSELHSGHEATANVT